MSSKWIPPLTKLIVLVLLTTNICLSKAQSTEGIFTAMAPLSLLPSSNYSVWVSGNPGNLDQLPPPLLIQIKCLATRPIQNGTNNNTTVPEIFSTLYIGTYRLRPDESARGSITIPKTLVAKNFEYCDLKVNHADKYEELKSTRLQLSSGIGSDDNETQIFIQMDKPVYKPGDTVRVRIILLDKNSIPDTMVSFKATLRNPSGIAINQWTNLQNHSQLEIDPNGLFKLRFPLASELNLGEWKIIVETKSGQVEKPFQVEEYVMPKFYIKFMTSRTYLTTSATSFTATISASYTYGKSLVGTLSTSFYNIENPNQKISSRDINLLDGKVFAFFDAAQLRRNLLEGMTFKLDVNATEIKTGRVQTASYTIRVYKEDPYEITWLNPQDTFKSNIPLVVKIAVSDQDGHPVKDSTPNALTLESGFGAEFIHQGIPANGIVTFSVNTSSIDDHLRLHIRYKSKFLQHYLLRSHDQVDDKYIFDVEPVIGVDDYLVRGQNFKLRLRASSNINLTKVNYALCSETEIVDFKAGQTVSTTTPAPLSDIPIHEGFISVILPEYRVYSELKVLVYFVYGEKDTPIGAFTTIPTNNYVRMNLSETTVGPAENVSLTFQTHAGSTIAIRGIDQSILLLSQYKDNNDVDPRSVPFNPYAVKSSISFLHAFMTNAYVGETPDLTLERRKRSTTGETLDIDNHLPVVSDYSLYEGRVRTRSHFPETWLWDEFLAVDSTTIYNKSVPIVPDTMTSWYVTAMSINKNSGFAVTTVPEILKVFRPFFITLDLPYAVIKHETFELRVIVHNYLGHDILASISLLNDDERFQFVDTRELGHKNVTKTVMVINEQVDVVSFIISPLVTGLLPLNVRAITDIAGDAISIPLRVEVPGKREWRSRPPIIYHGKYQNSTMNYTITPSRRRRDTTSTHKFIISTTPALTGGIMSSHNIKSLIQLPTGCGEQTMVKFVPNILAADYLKALDRLDSKTAARIGENLQIGYQEQMKYFRPSDGSFRYQSQDEVSSTWLTAFILRCFNDASKYITIDKTSVILKGLKFLLTKQNPKTGEFIETAPFLYNKKGFQGGMASPTSTKYGVSAYVTLALIEVSAAMTDIIPKADKLALDDAKLKGLRFISSESSLMDSDPYSLLVVTSTLHAARHPSRDLFFEKMEKMAMTKEKSTGEVECKWWQFDFESTPETTVTALSVEMTAYALMTYLWRSKVPGNESIPIVNWLVSQRTEGGGFESTQDTVGALTALIKYANRTSLFNSGNDVDIVIRTTRNATFAVKINDENSISSQDLLLPVNSELYEVVANGTGYVYLSFSEAHYTDKLTKHEDFKVEANLTANPERDLIFNFHLCVNYESESVKAGQVFAIAQLPSGHVFDGEGPITDLQKNVRKFKFEEQRRKVVVYFEYLEKAPTCLTFEVYKNFGIVPRGNGTVQVTDYYEPSITSGTSIDVDKISTVCDLCLDTNGCDIVSGCVINN